jgi:DNA segregation ATPase FtsK/SpoIIIE-like protein
VVTARSWAEVPSFIMKNLGFAIEFRLDDPATSLLDARQAALVPDLPGFGLTLPGRVQSQIAMP